MKVRFLYTKKPREFNYKPRYYDPEKEAFEQRREELLGARPVDGEYVPGSIIRSKTAARRESMAERKGGQKGKTLKLALLLAVIVFLTYFIFLK